jgi:hypothetical protein
MLNYFKNFFAKLLLLPVLALLGGFFLLFFLIIPQFKLFKDKDKVRPWSFNKRGKHGDQKEKDKEYEAFY